MSDFKYPTLPTRVFGLNAPLYLILCIVCLFTIFFNLIQSEFTCLYCLVVVIVIVNDIVAASTCYDHIWQQIQILRFFYCFIDCLESSDRCSPVCLGSLSLSLCRSGFYRITHSPHDLCLITHTNAIFIYSTYTYRFILFIYTQMSFIANLNSQLFEAPQ